MPHYEYRAVDREGREEVGTAEASSPREVVMSLGAKGLQVSSVKRIREGEFTLLGHKRRVTLDDLMLFNRQLASMINTDLPLVPSLQALSRDMRKGRFKTVLDKVRKDVEEGTSLTEALSKHPAVFSKFYLTMIRAGEKSGNLPGILSQLADHTQSMAMLQKKVKEALIYPALVIVVAMAILTFLVRFVIPTFAEMFRDMGQALPPLTRLILELHYQFRHVLIGLLALIGLIWLLKSWLARSKAGSLALDRLKLKLPIFGPFIRNTAIGNFCRTLGILLQAGVPMLNALELAGTASSNRLIEVACQEMARGVNEGERVTKPMKRFRIFPHTLVWMLSVGEQRGKLDESLLRLGGLYREQIERILRRIEIALVPICIIIIGLIVGSVIIALFLPLIQMAMSMSV